MVSTPIRKYATGSANPTSAWPKSGTAPVSTSATTRIRLVSAAGITSVHQRAMTSTATAITRLPASGRPSGVGTNTSAIDSAAAAAAMATERVEAGVSG